MMKIVFQYIELVGRRNYELRLASPIYLRFVLLFVIDGPTKIKITVTKVSQIKLVLYL